VRGPSQAFVRCRLPSNQTKRFTRMQDHIPLSESLTQGVTGLGALLCVRRGPLAQPERLITRSTKSTNAMERLGVGRWVDDMLPPDDVGGAVPRLKRQRLGLSPDSVRGAEFALKKRRA
jgi:hypothetical protein